MCAYSYFLSTPNTRASSRDSTRGERTTTIFIICPFTPVYSAEKQLPFVLRSYYSPLSFYAPRAHRVTRSVSPIRKPVFATQGRTCPLGATKQRYKSPSLLEKPPAARQFFSRASGGFLFRFFKRPSHRLCRCFRPPCSAVMPCYFFVRLIFRTAFRTVSPRHCFDERYMSRTLTSAGLTPLILEAWPMFVGRILFSFSIASRRSPAILP